MNSKLSISSLGGSPFFLASTYIMGQGEGNELSGSRLDVCSKIVLVGGLKIFVGETNNRIDKDCTELKKKLTEQGFPVLTGLNLADYLVSPEMPL